MRIYGALGLRGQGPRGLCYRAWHCWADSGSPKQRRSKSCDPQSHALLTQMAMQIRWGTNICFQHQDPTRLVSLPLSGSCCAAAKPALKDGGLSVNGWLFSSSSVLPYLVMLPEGISHKSSH